MMFNVVNLGNLSRRMMLGLTGILTISIMATYLGARDVVVAPIMKAATATQSGRVICQYLSPVRSACQAFKKEVITHTTYGL
jgi:hypothetical protein